jgi:hypothetical protein
MNYNIRQVAYRIDDDVSLATIDPLEGIKSTLAASEHLAHIQVHWAAAGK